MFIILGKLPTLNLPIKSHSSLSFTIFSNVILVPNYHGCKGEAINLIPHYLIDIIHKTVKPSHLKQLQIMQNITKLMFQVILIFSDWILIKQIIVFSKYSTWSFDWGNGAWLKIHRFNAFSRNVKTINWKICPTHGGTYKLEKIQWAFWREIKP